MNEEPFIEIKKELHRLIEDCENALLLNTIKECFMDRNTTFRVLFINSLEKGLSTIFEERAKILTARKAITVNSKKLQDNIFISLEGLSKLEVRVHYPFEKLSSIFDLSDRTFLNKTLSDEWYLKEEISYKGNAGLKQETEKKLFPSGFGEKAKINCYYKDDIDLEEADNLPSSFYSDIANSIKVLIDEFEKAA